MKTILIFVSTLDGKVTKWGDPHVQLWSSHQDQDYYKKIWNESRLIVMGSKTFEAEQRKASPEHHLVVMTADPDKYKSLEVAGQLEFTNESPAELTERFKKNGHQQMLVVGGPHVATSFLKEELIDELWLTIEPKIFGVGGNFVTEEKLDINLRLIHFEKVNEKGTLITKYAVVKK
ncbi:MAG TPA: dihydrofolate reductase [Chitinophagales bacterium]|nr:dihydrofolate reductase [Chitinophagales bacterium]